MDTTIKTIGERIKFIRKKMGITQTDVKNAIGIGQSTLSSIENDCNSPSCETALALSDFFGVSLEWLVAGRQPKREDNHNFSSEEIHLIEVYRNLSNINQIKIMERMETMIDVIKKDDEIYKAVPLIGYSAAGIPIEVLEDTDYQLLQTTKIKADFALTIKGASMEPMIEDGSIIFVRQTSHLENGEIGVFQINKTGFSTDEEVTCKIFNRLAPDHIELLSVNPKFLPIDIDPTLQSFKIVGKVIL